MSARRCSACAINYPNVLQHETCPGCGAKTDVLTDASPQEDWKRRAWEAFYTIHDAARQGPDPDELGRQEARELIDMDRRLT